MYGTLLARDPRVRSACVPPGSVDRGGRRHRPDHHHPRYGENHHRRRLTRFQMAPGTEAPPEIHFYCPRFLRRCACREATPQPVTPADPARRVGIRDPHSLSCYLTDANRPFRRPHRCGVRVASLAEPGTREHRRVPIACNATCMRICTTRRWRTAQTQESVIEIAECSNANQQNIGTAATLAIRVGQPHVKAVYQRLHGIVRRRQPCPLLAKKARPASPPLRRGDAGRRVVELAQAILRLRDVVWAAPLLITRLHRIDMARGSHVFNSDTLEQLSYGRRNRSLRNFFLSAQPNWRDGTSHR